MSQTLAVVVMLGVASWAAGIALYSWRRRDAPGAIPFVWLAGIVCCWSILSALHAGTGAAVWSKLRLTPIAGISIVWLVLILHVTGRSAWITRRRLAALALIPAVTQPLIWLNPCQLMWDRFPFDPQALQAGSSPPQLGPWFWFYAVYGYGLLGAGIGLQIWHLFRGSTLYRRQAGLLLIAILPPIATNVAFAAGWLDATGTDYTALSFVFTGTLVAVSLFRYRLFDVVPIARDALIDSMGDGMLVLDVHDRVVDLNPAMQAILGLQAGQAVGQLLGTLPLAQQELIGQFRSSTSGHAAVTLLRQGHPYHYDLQASSLNDRRGRPSGRLFVLRNVTLLKQAEESLRQSNRELSEHVKELDAFAHTVAHDLKTPLAALTGYASMLASTGPDLAVEELHADLQAMERNALKMASIVDELLLLASVRRAGAVELEPVNMAAIVDAVQTRLSQLIAEHQAEIVLPEVWPTALGRAAWVEEVWANYVSNALKYGGRPPRVELGATVLDGNRVRFWVCDNGPGLTTEQQARLFTEFTRLHQVRAEGHGLGLSIVQRIVDRLGGRVGVESEPGRGSVFYFVLAGSG